jgi:hypothetical protein
MVLTGALDDIAIRDAGRNLRHVNDVVPEVAQPSNQKRADTFVGEPAHLGAQR